MNTPDAPERNKTRVNRINACLKQSFLFAGAIVLLAVVLAGCGASFGARRTYLSPTKYQYVQQLYAKTHSLQIVRRTLEEERWLRPEINEALYRLEKENEIIDSEIIIRSGDRQDAGGAGSASDLIERGR